MTWLRPQTGAIPVPRPSALSRPYWDGLARGRLLFQRCARCAGPTHTPALICAHCGARELGWEPSSGRGTIYSFTVVWRPPTPAFAVPYAPAIVEVEEGWQMLSAIVGCEDDALEVGLEVAVEIHPAEGAVHLPYFSPRQP